MENFLHEILNFTGSFNLRLIILLFLICSLGEFLLISIPYLLETVWLMTGYHLGSGVMLPFQLVLLWLVAQAGRQVGAGSLFALSRFGISPLQKFYRRLFGIRNKRKVPDNNSLTARITRGMRNLTPYSVAFGRLFGLRVPLTLTMGIRKRFTTLSLGILLSSIVWDGIYIGLGIAGTRTTVEPTQMLIYSLAGLTALYIVTLSVRYLLRRRASHRNAGT